MTNRLLTTAVLRWLQAAGRSALCCCLSLQVALPRAPGAGGSSKRKAGSVGGSPVWTTTWTCDVVFSDDNTRVKQLQVRFAPGACVMAAFGRA